MRTCAIYIHGKSKAKHAPNAAVPVEPPSDPTNPLFDFNSLSVADLLMARNLRHADFVGLRGVVGTAIGRYFIRKGDSYPGVVPKMKGTGPKTLETTEIRPYSWPCLIVFVEKWIAESQFAHDKTPIRNLIPESVTLPDQRSVPVCVLEAPKVTYSTECNPKPVMPGNFIGGGYPVLCDVQGLEHYASVGCLLTDGHTVYALTNRHVAGKTGETIYALLEGEKQRIGKSSDKQLGRLAFESVYEGWKAKNVYLNLDIGLIELFDVTKWVPQVYGIGTLGPLADLSTGNITLSLINAEVRAYGAVSNEMEGCIYALFYRYSEIRGIDYVSDILIGGRGGKTLETHHGDSGTVWVLEPATDVKSGPLSTFRPIAVQWGGQIFTDSAGQRQKSFALGTLLSTVCESLEVTPVRDWAFELPEYWGTFGHFTMANIAVSITEAATSKARQFFENNLLNITFQIDDITVKGTGGLSKGPFVPLADVPDLVWKMPSGTGSRGPRGNNPEGPNHFADMDQMPPDGSPDLLTLCKDDDANVCSDAYKANSMFFDYCTTGLEQRESLMRGPFKWISINPEQLVGYNDNFYRGRQIAWSEDTNQLDFADDSSILQTLRQYDVNENTRPQDTAYWQSLKQKDRTNNGEAEIAALLSTYESIKRNGFEAAYTEENAVCVEVTGELLSNRAIGTIAHHIGLSELQVKLFTFDWRAVDETFLRRKVRAREMSIGPCYYSIDYGRFHSLEQEHDSAYEENASGRWESLLDDLVSPGEHIVDVGCNEGYNCLRAALKDCDVCGVDSSFVCGAWLNKLIFEWHVKRDLKASFVQAEAEQFNYPPTDTALVLNFIYHLRRDEQVPLLARLNAGRVILQGNLRKLPYHDHFYGITVQDMIQLLDEAGYCKVKVIHWRDKPIVIGHRN